MENFKFVGMLIAINDIVIASVLGNELLLLLFEMLPVMGVIVQSSMSCLRTLILIKYSHLMLCVS